MIKHPQLVALAVALVLNAVSARGADYRMLSSWDKNYPAIPVLVEPFIKNIEAASKGSIKIVLNGPETVPPFEQLQPVAAGAFQFLFTHGAYHFGTTPMLTALEAIGGDVESRRASGILDYVDRHYQKLGLKMIAMPMTPDGGYQIVTRQPVSASGDLQGRKLRGTPSYSGVFRMLGGSSPVVLPAGEIYTSLDKGVIDGLAWPAVGVLDYRWYEVAKYLVRPAFGFIVQPILMNLTAWNRLSEAERKLLLDEGRKTEDAWHRDSGRLAADEEKALVAKGMSISQIGTAQRAKMKQAWSEGLWEITSQKNKKDVDELRQFARQKGLAE